MNDTATLASQKGKNPSSQTILKAAALALLFSTAGIAIDAARTQAHAQDSATWLDTIAVVGTRTETSVQDNSASVAVVGEEEIARKSGESIADMLRDVPGVQVVDDSIPGMKRLSIRGESSRRVTILIDGQEITDHSNYGTPILVDPSNVERIEVVRGPASVLHGAKAIGGVV
ncbi:MAG TPA: TonB-dependent receptor plug domain-containing protein, partial [Aquamicrobium sp.]|nr:TonB-dependent receptor plug domain-containing protein [Aquamicrobium sp.]